MEHIGGRISEIERNIKIRGADVATRGGFTQVPNFVLKSNTISPGAKLAYSMLLHCTHPVTAALSRGGEAGFD